MTDEELDPTLATLLAHESGAPEVDPERLAKVRARTEAALQASLPDRPHLRSATKDLLRLGGVLAVGAALGATGYAFFGPKPVQPTLPAVVPVPIGAAHSSALVPPVPTTAPAQPASAPSTTAPSRPLVPAVRPSLASPIGSNLGAETPPIPKEPSASSSIAGRPTTALDEERGLVEQGRVALARRDWLSSIEAVRAHRQRFPNGQLAEERDALEVQALAAGGHSADARRKGEAFLSAYPQSMLRGRIDALLRELPK